MRRRVSAGFLWILAATILFEGVTCLLRFGLGMQSTRDTGAIGRFTFGLRIHHSYVGLVVAIASFFLPPDRPLRIFVFRVGVALVLSDLIHHFVVLRAVTGSPQFDLSYPALRN